MCTKNTLERINVVLYKKMVLILNKLIPSDDSISDSDSFLKVNKKSEILSKNGKLGYSHEL